MSAAASEQYRAFVGGMLGGSGYGSEESSTTQIGLPVANSKGADTTKKAGSANQGGQPKDTGGALNPFALMMHYMGGSGDAYLLSRKAFMELITTMYMKKGGGIDFRNGKPVPGIEGLYQVGISAYHTNLSYPVAVGSATLYYNSSGIVGYSDYLNFDAQTEGSRSEWAEVATRFGRNFGSITHGAPFWVYYGETPGLTSLPKH